jgi:F-type H+-transporting ATPase subunit gamma
MSDTLASLRRKIDGAGKLKSVVRTMKAVAASSIGQYESAVRSLADYEHSVELGLGVCFRKGSSIKATSKRGMRDGAIGAVVFGSDQGLVGQFNESIAEFVEKKLTSLPGRKKIWTIGERISGRLVDIGLAIERQFAVPTSVGGITSLVGQLQIALEDASKNGCDEIHVFHAQPTVGSLYEPVAKKLISLDETWQRALSKAHWPTNNLPELFGDTTTHPAGLHPRILVHRPVQGMRRVTCRRERQPARSHAEGREEHRIAFDQPEPKFLSPPAKFHR